VAEQAAGAVPWAASSAQNETSATFQVPRSRTAAPTVSTSSGLPDNSSV
jgi:hypothetical protein